MRDNRVSLSVSVALTIPPVVILVAMGVRSGSTAYLIGAVAAVAALLSVAYVIFLIRFLGRNPTTVVMAMIGPPRCGKTVYLTVLFRELMLQNSRMMFRPYGSETIEKINADIAIIEQGSWLPPTPIGVYYPYRLQASLARALFPRRFRIEISDFAGEHLEEFDSSSEWWLHKTDFFKVAVDSDAILIGVDCQPIAEGNRQQIATAERLIVAALQVLIERKDVAVGRRLRTPVAVLFLKSDLISDIANPLVEAEQAFPRLCAFGRSNCETFRTFAVSSVGHVKSNGAPPDTLAPTGVVNPMLWLLSRTYRSASIRFSDSDPPIRSLQVPSDLLRSRLDRASF